MTIMANDVLPVWPRSVAELVAVNVEFDPHRARTAASQSRTDGHTGVLGLGEFTSW